MFSQQKTEGPLSPPHHRLHHVGLGVAQGLGREEGVHHAVVTDHLQDHGAGAERPAPTAAVPTPRSEGGRERGERGGGRGERKMEREREIKDLVISTPVSFILSWKGTPYGLYDFMFLWGTTLGRYESVWQTFAMI